MFIIRRCDLDNACSHHGPGVESQQCGQKMIETEGNRCGFAVRGLDAPDESNSLSKALKPFNVRYAGRVNLREIRV